MLNDKIIKLRISGYLKTRASDAALTYNWILSNYVRFLIMMDLDSKIFDRIIPLIEGNVSTNEGFAHFTHEGHRFYIVPEEQVKKIAIGVDEKK